MNKRAVGNYGESIAVEYLKKKAYKIIERNFRCPFGEIDIIAKENNTIVFVEVKSRKSKDFALPEQAVDRNKQKNIIKVAQYFLNKNNLRNVPCRFDIVSFIENESEIKLIRNAFEIT